MFCWGAKWRTLVVDPTDDEGAAFNDEFQPPVASEMWTNARSMAHLVMCCSCPAVCSKEMNWNDKGLLHADLVYSASPLFPHICATLFLQAVSERTILEQHRKQLKAMK